MADPVTRRRGSTRTPAVLGGEPAFGEPVYITRALAPDGRAFARRIDGVLTSRWFTNDGPAVRELEAELRERLAVGFCAAFCNGTVALQAALRFLELEGEVITTPFTFPATAHAIEWNGLTPVFCDVDPETWNLDVDAARDARSGRTSAVVPVHVFGNPCDVAGLEALARQHGLKLVYDAAHAFGVRVGGRAIGEFGDLSVLSFHATKLFHTAEGGAVVGRDPGHFPKLHLLRNFGIVSEDEVRGVGLNGKLSELHAALGLCLLDAADREIEARVELAVAYDDWFSGVEGLVLQRFHPGTDRNHAYYAVRIEEDAFGLSRDALQAALRTENVITRRYFSPLCSDNESYRRLPSARPERLPNARRLAETVLCLPLYGELGSDGVDRCAEALIAIRDAAPRVRRALRGAS